MGIAIQARGLARTFKTRSGRDAGEVKAVAGVDLDIADGEIVGFLGPNGAGKTTTLRMLTTLLKPTAGQAIVAGFDSVAEPEQVRRRIGYVSQAGSTGAYARAGDEVVDHALLYGVPAATARQRGLELFEQLQLDGLWNRQPGKMSGGQRRRLDVVMGLIHQPTLMFLDEPTTGLDPQARANLWQHIRALRDDRGTTVFLTTHYLDEADALSDRIIVIDHGSVVAADTSAALKRQLGGDLVELEVAPADVPTTAAILERAGGAEVDSDVRHVRARIQAAGSLLPSLLRELGEAGVGIAGVEIRRPSLDDVFLNLTGRSLRESD